VIYTLKQAFDGIARNTEVHWYKPVVHNEMYRSFNFVTKTILEPIEQKESQESFMFKFITLPKAKISHQVWQSFYVKLFLYVEFYFKI